MPGLLKKIIWIGLALITMIHCEIDRNNPLDPKNPASVRNRTVLIEAFVNNGTGQQYVEYALQALDQIGEQFENDVIIIEYHIASSKWIDSLSTSESRVRYNQYTGENFGIPDIFIDGGKFRIQGASSYSSVFNRCRQAVESAIIDKAYLTIEAQTARNGNFLTIDGKIARLGHQSAEHVVIRGVIIEDLPALVDHHHVARQILTPQSIGTLAAGEIESFSMQIELKSCLNFNNSFLVLFAQDEVSNTLYQAAKFTF